MSSPAPDSGQTWTGADSQPSPRRAPAQAGGAGRHRAPGAHRRRAGVNRTVEPRPVADRPRTTEHGQHRTIGGPPAGGAGAPSLVRSSSVMALGTLASRVTGLLRT